MTKRTYNLHRSMLEVDADDARFWQALSSLIGEMEMPSAPTGLPASRLVLVQELDASVTKAGTLFHNGMLEGHGAYEFRRIDGGWTLWQDGTTAGWFLKANNAASLMLSPTCPDEKLTLAIAFAIDHAIEAGGQKMIHGACLQMPGREECIVLHARSGTGKSTLALALALAGFRLCSDDTVVIGRSSDSQINAWGIPRSAKILPQTRFLLPGLDAFIDDAGINHRGKLTLSREKMRAADMLGKTEPKKIAALIHLSRQDKEAVSWRKLDKFDGLMSLAGDNLNFGPTGFFPGHEFRLDLLTGLLTDTPAYELLTGTNIAACVDAVRQIVTNCRT